MAVVGAPYAVSAVGFKAGGIAVGSKAAVMMSAMAPTKAGSAVAILQSVGAVGLKSGGAAVVAAAGGTVGGAAGAAAKVISKIF